jgi:hypothetical protein
MADDAAAAHDEQQRDELARVREEYDGQPVTLEQLREQYDFDASFMGDI